MIYSDLFSQKRWIALGILLFSVAMGRASYADSLTPLLMEVLAEPVPVKGSDGAYHLAYELQLSNASSRPWNVENLAVSSADNGKKPVAQWLGADLKNKMAILGSRLPSTTLQPGQSAVVWISLKFSDEKKIPHSLSHQLVLNDDKTRWEESGGITPISTDRPVEIAPPLKGDHWIAADGCCESTRHVRALLPIQGKLFTAQRFAIDWEQIGAGDAIYQGDPKKVESYSCYGKEVYAVADGKVMQALDGLPNQVPGKLPEGLPVEQADGNHVIQEIAPGHYALYAHFMPGSLKVKAGDWVKKGQLLALVGNSGNSSAPHLHFHVMDRPAALASNGLPYVLTQFEWIGRIANTEAFDQAEAAGSPVKILPASHPGTHHEELPLDQNVINFSLR
jgi:peptidase M23-like protein